MAICAVFDEHHGWQVVDIPADKCQYYATLALFTCRTFQESRQDLSLHLSPKVSSTTLLSWCSQSLSMCHLSGANTSDSLHGSWSDRTRCRKKEEAQCLLCLSPTICVESVLRVLARDRDVMYGATLPRGGLPQNSVSILKVLSRTSFCCSNVMSAGFSWLYPCSPIS